MTDFAILSLGIFLIAMSIKTIYDIIHKSSSTEFDQSYMLSSAYINPIEISEMFNAIIDETIHDYIILNVPFKEYEYINADREKELLSEISNVVIDRMTPSVIAKLALIYPIEIDEKLFDFVTHKVYIKLLDIIVSQNSNFTNTDKKEKGEA